MNKKGIAMVLCLAMAVSMGESSVSLAAGRDRTETVAGGEAAGNERQAADGIRQAEALDRGVIAMKTADGVYLSWRYLGTDAANTSFDIYRDGQKITAAPVADSTNYVDKQGTLQSVYSIHTLVAGKETQQSEDVRVNANDFFDIILDKPAPGVTPTGQEYDYTPNDASCGDLDGDGEYEIVLKWMPSNSGDNMPDGYRGNVYYDAYKLNGTRLWRIDMGVNIRAGAHYTPFMVYDFDGDGYAELVMKTADGTIDGRGKMIGKDKDWRNQSGTIMDGPEYLTLFDGFTGEALDTVDYEPGRNYRGKPEENVNADYWGDGFGNRSERYLAAVAYLNGTTPSVLMCRGYYVNFGIAAYDIVDKKFQKRWFFDTAEEGNEDCIGQGNHNLSVADADGDGFDEIVYGACTIDHDGTMLYSNKFGHGDALHVSDFDPEHEGLEIWSCFEHTGGAALRDAKTGEVLFRAGEGPWDTGRCVAGNFVASHPGSEFAYIGSGLLDAQGNPVLNEEGKEIGWPFKWSMNSAVYWDGELERQSLDRTFVECYQHGRELTAAAGYNNGTKGNCCLSADLFGDWREEIIFPAGDRLRVYSTTIPTKYRIATLMHDTQYRCQVACQNVGYNQPPHTSFFLGTGYPLPEQPDIEEIKAPVVKQKTASWDFEIEKDGAVADSTGKGNILSLQGAASVQDNAVKESGILVLDGTNGTYAQFPAGMFDNLTETTIEMDVRVDEAKENAAVFALGSEGSYLTLEIMDTTIKASICKDSVEQKAEGTIASCQGKWMHLALVVSPGSLKIYKDRTLLAEKNDLTISLKDLGQELSACLGKSYASGDTYFQGALDNVEVYNYAKTAADIAYTETVSVDYRIKEGGRIEGRAQQTILKGNTASKVRAVPHEGWRFVRWSDGSKDPQRQEVMLENDFAVTAIFGKETVGANSLVASYDFETVDDICVEDSTKNGYPIRLRGNAQIVKDDITESNVLNVNGSGDTFGEFEEGMFDHLDEMTVLMDVRSYMAARTNFFTFAVGKDTDKYLFFKLADTQLRAAMTNNGHGGEKSADAAIEGSWGEWTKIALVIRGNKLLIYRDQELAAETDITGTTVSGLGEQVKAYLGKSFYAGDAYFNGSFDNLKVYNYAMTKEQLDEASSVAYVTVRYEAEDAYGMIQGESEQRIKKGSKTQEVEAVPKEEYRFVRWSDGIMTARRQDTFVAKDKSVKAVFAKKDANENGLIAAYDFEADYEEFAADTSLQGNLLDYHGEAQVKKDSDLGSRVLYLNGTTDTYANLPQGLFDGMDSFTLRMKVKPESTQGNFFTFAVGSDDQKYLYFKTMDKAVKTVITSSGNGAEQVAQGGVDTCTDRWLDMTIVVEPDRMKMYEGKYLVAEKSGVTVPVSELGENPSAFLGKSFYGADTYFKGSFDDIELYNYAWNSKQIVDDTGIVKEKIADFSMKDAQGLKGNGAVASVMGTAKFVEDETRGGAMSFDGTGSCYLKVAKEDGGSLLGDVEEFTVSYYSKAERAGSNWTMYAASDETAPTLNQEKYIGIIDDTDNLKVERYWKGRGEDPAMAAKGKDSWKHVVVAFHKNRSVLYVDGKQIAVTDSNNKIHDIVGNEGIFQIGKANWGNGEFYQGLLSDYQVYNYAMTAEEVERFEATGEPLDPNEPGPNEPEPDEPEKETVTITYKAQTGGIIQGKTSQIIEKGKDAETVKAVPLSGYIFVKWSDGVTSDLRKDTNVQKSQEVTALFTRQTVAVSGIKLNKKKLTLGVKESFTLKALISPAAADKTLNWKSGNPKVATVSKNGKVKAKKIGKATITATASNGVKAVCRITVKKAPKKISLNAKSKTLRKGKGFQVRVKLPKGTASNKITYKSSKRKVATVSSKGKVKALRKGKAAITVTTFNKKKATIKITVR